MDQLDKYIQDIVSQKITEPDDLEEIMLNAIHTAKGKKRIRRYKITRAIITSVTTIIIITGVGVAGFIAYDKIWKNPEKYTYEEIQETIAEGNNVGEVENLITEETAKQSASQILNNLGYGNEEIKSIELQKDINNNDEPFYVIKTKGKEEFVITLNAKNGDFKSFTNNSFQNINLNETQIDTETARKYADNMLKNIGVEGNEYKFKECKQQQTVYNNETKNIWVAEYYKMYDGIYNPYEMLKANFVINDKNLEISSIIETTDGIYDNNPEVITEQQAKEIAVNKEKEFTDKEIESATAEKGIRKQNKYIYKLENNIDISNNDVTNAKNLILNTNFSRRSWIIKIKHKNIDENTVSLETNERLRKANKIYYIDATTGEILGGEELIEGGN